MSLTASHYRTPKPNWLWLIMMIWISFIQLVNTAMIYTKHSSFSTVERRLWGCCHTIANNCTGNWGQGWQYIFKSVFESQVQYSSSFIYSQAAPQIFWIFEAHKQHESAWFILMVQFTVHPFLSNYVETQLLLPNARGLYCGAPGKCFRSSQKNLCFALRTILGIVPGLQEMKIIYPSISLCLYYC